MTGAATAAAMAMMAAPMADNADSPARPPEQEYAHDQGQQAEPPRPRERCAGS